MYLPYVKDLSHTLLTYYYRNPEKEAKERKIYLLLLLKEVIKKLLLVSYNKLFILFLHLLMSQFLIPNFF